MDLKLEESSQPVIHMSIFTSALLSCLALLSPSYGASEGEWLELDLPLDAPNNWTLELPWKGELIEVALERSHPERVHHVGRGDAALQRWRQLAVVPAKGAANELIVIQGRAAVEHRGQQAGLLLGRGGGPEVGAQESSADVAGRSGLLELRLEIEVRLNKGEHFAGRDCGGLALPVAAALDGRFKTL